MPKDFADALRSVDHEDAAERLIRTYARYFRLCAARAKSPEPMLFYRSLWTLLESCVHVGRLNLAVEIVRCLAVDIADAHESFDKLFLETPPDLKAMLCGITNGVMAIVAMEDPL